MLAETFVPQRASWCRCHYFRTPLPSVIRCYGGSLSVRTVKRETEKSISQRPKLGYRTRDYIGWLRRSSEPLGGLDSGLVIEGAFDGRTLNAGRSKLPLCPMLAPELSAKRGARYARPGFPRCIPPLGMVSELLELTHPAPLPPADPAVSCPGISIVCSCFGRVRRSLINGLSSVICIWREAEYQFPCSLASWLIDSAWAGVSPKLRHKTIASADTLKCFDCSAMILPLEFIARKSVWCQTIDLASLRHW